jgi:hypothetical protein
MRDKGKGGGGVIPATLRSASSDSLLELIFPLRSCRSSCHVGTNTSSAAGTEHVCATVGERRDGLDEGFAGMGAQAREGARRKCSNRLGRRGRRCRRGKAIWSIRQSCPPDAFSSSQETISRRQARIWRQAGLQLAAGRPAAGPHLLAGRCAGGGRQVRSWRQSAS